MTQTRTPGLSVYVSGSPANSEKAFLKKLSKEEIEFADTFLMLCKHVLLRHETFGFSEFAQINYRQKDPLKIELLRKFVGLWANENCEQGLLTKLPAFVYSEDTYYQCGDISRAINMED